MNSELSLLRICQKCGAKCCIHGTPVFSCEEKDKIVKKTGKEKVFIENEGLYFINTDNPCPFLDKNNLCTIQDIKPVDCLAYPRNLMTEDERFVCGTAQRCPAQYFLNEIFDISQADRLLLTLPEKHKEAIVEVNKKCNFKITKDNFAFGMELILDMYGCDTSLFNQKKITEYLNKLCAKINMRKYGTPKFWLENKSDELYLRGISAVQFITTSNITVHALEVVDSVYINIFSCKLFDVKKAEIFSKDFFKAEKIISKSIERR